MGNEVSTQAKWSVNVTIRKSEISTSTDYTLSSTSDSIVKTVTSGNGSSIVYRVDPTNHEMYIKDTPAGIDGDIATLGAVIRSMRSRLNEKWPEGEQKPPQKAEDDI